MDNKQKGKERILSGLRDIRRKRRIYWISTFIFFFAFISAYALTGSQAIMISALVVASIANVVMFNRICQSKCPQCGGLFHRPKPVLSWHAFPGECVHCGLKVNQDK